MVTFVSLFRDVSEHVLQCLEKKVLEKDFLGLFMTKWRRERFWLFIKSQFSRYVRLLRPCCATVIIWVFCLCDILAKYLCVYMCVAVYLRPQFNNVLTQTDKASITCQPQMGVRILVNPDATSSHTDEVIWGPQWQRWTGITLAATSIYIS